VRYRVLHHRAKALRNLKRFPEAIELCQQILEKRQSRATKLLLARLLVFESESRERAKVLLFDLLSEARAEPHAEISVTLAAIAVLGQWQLKKWFREALAEFGKLLADLIVEAAVRGFDQAFVAFAAIGRDLQYNDEALFFRVFDELPLRSLDDVQEDKERAAWGDILLAAAKARSGEQHNKLLAEALQWYDSMLQPEPFNLQQKGQVLFLQGECEQAIATLEPLAATEPNPWNRYWLSKALLKVGDLLRARTLIDDALNDPKSERYRSAFLEHRFDIRDSVGDSAAVDDLDEACRFCESPKYKAALESRLLGKRQA